MVLTRSPYLFMAMVKCLEPSKNPWLLSSICCLFPSQMTFLSMSSCTINANTSASVRVRVNGSTRASLICSVSPDHRRRFCSCSSRSPTQSGPPRPSLKPPAEGSRGGRARGLPSAGRGRAALQEDQSETTTAECSSSKYFYAKALQCTSIMKCLQYWLFKMWTQSVKT